MEIQVDSFTSYTLVLTETESRMLNGVAAAKARSAVEILGDIAFGGICSEHAELEAISKAKPFNPADLD